VRGGKTLLLAQFAAAALTILAAACVKPDVLRADPPVAASTSPIPNRTECDQIFGTAYHSPEERDWFEANCTTWPAFSAPDGPAPSAQNQVGPSQATTTPATAIGPDRTNCNEIRGTAYRSDTERSWYLRTCFLTPTAVPTTPRPPASVFPQQVPLIVPGLPPLQPPGPPVTPVR
jgi:hypothetical protein